MTLIFNLLKQFISLLLAFINILGIQFDTETVELYANPSSGYDWEYSFDKTGIITLTESHYAPDAASVLTGKGGGTKNFTFRTLNSGTVEITFEYVKYIQEERIVASKYVYTYNVDINGEISLLNKNSHQ